MEGTRIRTNGRVGKWVSLRGNLPDVLNVPVEQAAGPRRVINHVKDGGVEDPDYIAALCCTYPLVEFRDGAYAKQIKEGHKGAGCTVNQPRGAGGCTVNQPWGIVRGMSRPW